MMKIISKWFLLLVILFSNNKIYSQTTIFDRITEELLLNKDTSAALVKIDSLLILKDQEWTKPILNYKIDIGKIYLIKEEYEKYYNYFLKYENTYYLRQKHFDEDSLFRIFKKTKYYLNLFIKNQKEWATTENEEYALSVSKEVYTFNRITNADQFFRNYVKKIKQPTVSDSLKGSLILSTDSCNIKEFMNEYKNSATFDYLVYYDLFYIHVFTTCNSKFVFSYKFIDSLLRKNIFSGKYNPSNYASIIDYSLSYEGGCGWPQKYGSQISNKQMEININNISNVDLERRKIGLQPLWMDALIAHYQLPNDYPLPEEAKKYYFR